MSDNKKEYKIETKCVQAGYKAESGQPQVPPLVQSTTYRYYAAEDVAALFDLDSTEFMYSRLGSPTPTFFEQKVAALEGGTAAVATSSGQSAVLITMLNLCKAGDEIISTSTIYGGTYNLLAVTMKNMGINVKFVDQEAPAEEILKAASDKTKAVFAESLGNPALTVLDFEKFSKIAKELNVPLVVDNTLASPYLCRPLEHGANIVIHSTTKYIDGHATSVGGIVVDGGNFDWAAAGDKFPGMVQPDESYHGLKYYEKFGNIALAIKLRAHLLRDLGCVMSPMNAFMSFQGCNTLHLRMERHCQNALALAKHLKDHEMVDWIVYPGLEGDKYHELAKKYLPKGASGVLSFGVKGGRKAGEKFLEAIQLTSLVVHVGDIRTSVLHPASSTHRQLSEEAQIAGGIKPELIRVSVGIENIEDIIEDFDFALDQVKKSQE